VPRPDQMPTGCRFHPRCAYAAAVCVAEPPALVRRRGVRADRCVRHPELTEADGSIHVPA
jgi:oligopeptide/dipeptide ABC transporter ATP-binding protein